MSDVKHTQGMLHTGGTFNPGAPDESQWLWSERAPGAQSGQVVAKDITPANAARLAHCWNCHDEMLAVLEAVEWSGYGGWYTCPSCGNRRSNGHAADCKLAAAIRKAKGDA